MSLTIQYKNCIYSLFKSYTILLYNYINKNDEYDSIIYVGGNIMIYGNIDNCEKYQCLNENFKRAFQFLINNDLKELPVGRYDIQGEDVFAMVQEYETKAEEEGKYEAHKKYIDIQYMVEGEEKVGYAFVENLETCLPYDSEKDFMLLEGNKEFFGLRNNEFYIFFPEDAHMPGIAKENKTKVKKVVIKVKVQ